MKIFSSVSTNAARFQDIALNPQKLAGMCAKLKCCLNYEVDEYIEASRKLPGRDIVLQTADSDYYFFKSDILSGMITYSTDKRLAANLETITGKRALQVMEMNKRGEKPQSLTEENGRQESSTPVDMFEGDVTRFDRSRKKRKPKGTRAQGQRQTRQTKDTRERPAAGNRGRNGNRENRSGQTRQTRGNGGRQSGGES